MNGMAGRKRQVGRQEGRKEGRQEQAGRKEGMEVTKQERGKSKGMYQARSQGRNHIYKQRFLDRQTLRRTQQWHAHPQ
jgi:hypothetical protein